MILLKCLDSRTLYASNCKTMSDLEIKTNGAIGEPNENADENVQSLDFDDSGSTTLISSDEFRFTLEKKSLMISKLVMQALENDANATEVPIPGAKGAILELIIRYMTHHQGVEPPIIEKPLRSKLMKDVCKDKWDADFIDEIGNNRQKLYDLILAANYMDIKGLLHLGCAKVASLIKGQPLEKIKGILAVDQPAAETKVETKSDSPEVKSEVKSVAETKSAATNSPPSQDASAETNKESSEDEGDGEGDGEGDDEDNAHEEAADVTMHTS